MNLPCLTPIVLVLLQSAAAPPRGSSDGGQELATVKSQAEAGDVKAQVQLGLAYASGDASLALLQILCASRSLPCETHCSWS